MTFRFTKRGKYESAVWVAVMVLSFSPSKRYKQQLLQAYPGIKNTIKGHFSEGTSPEYVAAMIVNAVITDQIDEMSDGDRLALREQMADTDDTGLSFYIVWMLERVEDWEKEDKIPEGAYERIFHGIGDAIAFGDGPDNRSNRWIEKALDKALGTTDYEDEE